MAVALLTTLPQENIIEILAYSDHRAILRCASTCRLLYEICKSSVQLRYIVQLAVDGFRDAVVAASHSELLSRLQDLRLSWANMKWKRFNKVDVRGICIAYELVAGVFAMSNGQGLSVDWLPSSTMDGRRMDIPTVGVSVRDFAMDPTQDLIIILEDDHIPISYTQGRRVCLHTRTLSATAPHPLASCGRLEFDIAADHEFGNAIFMASIEIAVDVVGLFFNKAPTASRPRLLIWNWRKGQLVYDSDTIGDRLSPYVHHFTLLNRDSFLLSSTLRHGSLRLYSFDPVSPALSIPMLCTTLRLPPIHNHCSILQLTVHSGPISSTPPENMAFTASTESHLLVLSLFYSIQSEDGPSTVNYNLFVHKRTFLDYIDLYHQTQASENVIPGTCMEWDDWGESNTRLMAPHWPRSWLRYVHGQRVVSNFRDSQSIEVLNFNVTSLSSIPDNNFRLCNTPSCDYPGNLFRHQFMTRLPYYSSVCAMGEPFYACMIDEERIIGLKMNHDDIQLCIYAF